MRLWLADSKKTYCTLRDGRRRLLTKTDGLAALPWHERLWHGHLYWVMKFAKIESTSAFRCTTRIFIRGFCKVADRLFGGNRYERYLEARRREVEECKRKAEESETKARRLQTSLQRNAEDRFIDRLADELLLNPNFVPPKKRTIQ